MRTSLIFLTLALSIGASAANYKISDQLGPKDSRYTQALITLNSNYPQAKSFCTVKGDEVQLYAIKTKDRPYYVGMKKCMLIPASLDAIAKVVEGFNDFEKLFPGFKNVHIVSQHQNRTVLSWERIIPVFFAANVVYRLGYVSDKTNPNLYVFRYQLMGGERLTSNDGIEWVEKISPNLSLFVNYEFYEADYSIGVLGMQAAHPSRVWKESTEGAYLSLFSLSNKAQHPEWSFEKILKESDKRFAALPESIYDLKYVDFQLPTANAKP